MDNQERYKKAKKRVEEKIGFYLHLAAYILVNALLIFINLTTSPENLWFKWPMIGWGIGLFLHAVGTFAFSEGSAIKERMIEKEMNKKD